MGGALKAGRVCEFTRLQVKEWSRAPAAALRLRLRGEIGLCGAIPSRYPCLIIAGAGIEDQKGHRLQALDGPFVQVAKLDQKHRPVVMRADRLSPNSALGEPRALPF